MKKYKVNFSEEAHGKKIIKANSPEEAEQKMRQLLLDEELSAIDKDIFYNTEIGEIYEVK